MPVQQTSISIAGFDIGGALVGGAVDVGDTAPNRVARFTMVDTEASFGAAAASSWIGNEIEITVNGTVVFTGPLATLLMSNKILQVEAVDATVYGLDPELVTVPFVLEPAASYDFADVISDLVTDIGHGITFANPDSVGTRLLKHDFNVERGAERWNLALDVAAKIGKVLYMSRTKVATLQRWRGTATDEFTLAEDILSQPTIGFDLVGGGFRNYVDAVGHALCSDDVWHVTAAAVGDLSPATLGRTFVHELEEEGVDDEADLQDDADDLVDKLSAFNAPVNFDVNLWGHEDLEPFDLVDTPYGKTRVSSFSIPLDGTGFMTVGVGRRIRTKHRSGSKSVMSQHG